MTNVLRPRYTAYRWVHGIYYWQGGNVKCGRHGMAAVQQRHKDMMRVGWKKCNISSQEGIVSWLAAIHSVF